MDLNSDDILFFVQFTSRDQYRFLLFFFLSVIGRFANSELELELELIQTQMTQKPMLRAEVYARALRASQNRKEDSL